MRRREVLSAAAAAGLAVATAACAPRPDRPPGSGVPFEGVGPYPCGLLSADPTPEAVLLWTRVHPGTDSGGGVDVEVDVSRDPGFGAGSRVAILGATATGATDHCVQVDATGLEPGTTYWYRFRSAAGTSRVGRTRTAPAPGDASGSVRVAAFSCQRYTHGFYNAHADLAALAADPATDVDLVLSLGDYVYDTGYADGVWVPGREDPIQAAVTREQFRSKYRLGRSDPSLQAVHAAYPVVSVFDNHDGLARPGDPQADGALGAFAEYVPVRPGPRGGVDRRFAWGDHLDVFMTDQRSHRDPEVPESGVLGTSTDERPEILDPGRTILGSEQFEWLAGGLETSTATWRVIGSQLMFWPWRSLAPPPGSARGAGVYLNMSQWDGYAGERLRLLDRLESAGVEDTVLFSGDSHVFSAAQVAPDVDDPASVPRVVDIGTGSVTSNNADENGWPTTELFWPWLRTMNPHHLRYFQSERHGYAVAELGDGGATVELRSPRTIRRADPTTDVLARLRIERGAQRVRRVA